MSSSLPNISSPWVPTSPVGSGDNAWQLVAASLVALQSVPGLVVLYAGIMKTKWAINSAFMALYAFAMTLVCWVIWAYKVGFGDQMLPFAGFPRPLMTSEDGLEQALLPAIPVTANFPQATMAYFQFVFAAITIVIMGGAFLGRMNFTA
jgi:ammonium transporter, Amt family